MGMMTRVAVALGLAASVAGAQEAFEDVTEDVGLAGYRATTGDSRGPGGVFADLSGDGYPDLYLVRALSMGPPGTNQLFLNIPGPVAGRYFVEMPDASGAADAGDATGAIAGDYDNDGDLDLYVVNFDGANVLFKNMLVESGTMSFVDVTASTDPTPGVADDQLGVGNCFYEGVALDNSLTAAWGDPDRDGDLDLYVGNHNGYFEKPLPFEGPYDVPGRRDVFYINNGDGTFTDMTMAYDVPGWVAADGSYENEHQRFSSSNAVIFADFNNDRWPDLLATNKIGGPTDRDMLYINQGADADGTWLGFRVATYDLSPEFGAASTFAMGIDVADLDNDGDLDMYITDMSDIREPSSPGMNDLWLGQLADTGAFGFELAADVAPAYHAPAKLGWGAQFQDFNNDGWQDLHTTTSFPFRDYLYMNTGTGFAEQAEALGIARDRREARGSMSADYDRDGWIDLFLINIDGLASAMMRNGFADMAGSSNGFLSIRVEGDPTTSGPLRSTRDAIGARVLVSADLDGDGTIEAGETQMKEVASGSSNAASTSGLDLEFGLGLASVAMVEVRWPSGVVSNHEFAADSFVEIREAAICPADLDGDGDLTIFDFLAFQNLFDAGDVAADFDGDGVLTIFDFLVFQNLFQDGCA
ncbi:MAG: FG-GAP-like repeat-containing protein [Phycisphaera sp.]|nr:MAG: FG-GAP-like repeat-containing protein [Phycisphaera sp.]